MGIYSPLPFGSSLIQNAHSDNVNGAGPTLSKPTGLPSPVTIEGCTSACFNGGYRFSGTEYSGGELFWQLVPSHLTVV
jgi:hypothetical protein